MHAKNALLTLGRHAFVRSAASNAALLPAVSYRLSQVICRVQTEFVSCHSYGRLDTIMLCIAGWAAST